MSEGTGIPVVSIVGKSDSGKTTLVEGVVRALVARGHRVATCKHHVHEVDIDIPGKDSWRHAHAGASVSMIASPSQFAVVRKVDEDQPLDVIAGEAMRGGCDILITEGFKRAGSVRIEVSRLARSDELISEPDELFALVSDNPELEVPGVPRFDLNDHAGVVDLIEASFLSGGDA